MSLATAVKKYPSVLWRFLIGILKLRETGILLSFILMCTIFGLLSPDFFTAENFFNVTRQFSIYAILAVGQTLVIITAGIDLSVGSVLALSSCIMAKFMMRGLDMYPCMGIGLAIGALCGFSNGLMITHIGLPPFIVTLGMMSVARGLTYVITRGWPVGLLPDSFKVFGEGALLGIPIPVIIMVIIAFAGSILLRRTNLGRYIYSVGGNEEAARLSGINVSRVKIIVYTISGLLAALSGIVVTSRVSLAQATAGTMYELECIAASVVGGTSLMGGEGSALGAVIGAAIMGVLKNGLHMLKVPANWQMVPMGLVVIAAVAIDKLRQRRRVRGG